MIEKLIKSLITVNNFVESSSKKGVFAAQGINGIASYIPVKHLNFDLLEDHASSLLSLRQWKYWKNA